LSRVIMRTADTAAKIDALLDRADLFPPRSFDRAEADIKQAEQLALASGNLYKLIAVYNLYGLVIRKTSQHQDAIIQFKKAKKIALQHKATEDVGKADYNIGSEYALLTMADSATYYLNEAQRAFANVVGLDPKYALFINNTLGVLYRRMGKYEESLAEYDKALERHRDDPDYAYLGGIYSSKANTLSMLNRLDEAIELQLK